MPLLLPLLGEACRSTDQLPRPRIAVARVGTGPLLAGDCATGAGRVASTLRPDPMALLAGLVDPGAEAAAARESSGVRSPSHPLKSAFDAALRVLEQPGQVMRICSCRLLTS